MGTLVVKFGLRPSLYARTWTDFVVSVLGFDSRSEEIAMIRSRAAADTAVLLTPLASSSEGFHALDFALRSDLVPA